MLVTDWPPAYTVKRHPRARGVKLTFTRERGLRITLPTRYSLKHIPSILEENKAWILKHTNLQIKKPTVEKTDAIHLLAFEKRWSVHYFQTNKSLRIRQFSYDGIILSGDIQDTNLCRDKLKNWLKKQAKLLLIPYFKNLASEMQMSYSDITIRSQSTLWGSCSQDKSIRLNYKLLFLPEKLMRHIMIHELCHTKEMNHSEKFWQWVAHFDPDWAHHKKVMKKADQYMPSWI